MLAMDSLNFPGLLVATISLLLIWKFTTRKRRTSATPLPPGTLGFPLIGETISFLKSMVSNRPWDFYLAREARYGKVFKTSLFGRPLEFVSPPVGSKLLFTSHNKFVGKASPLPTIKLLPDNTLLHTDGNESKEFRQILYTFLGPDAMHRHVESTSMLIEQHLDTHWKDEDVVHAYPLIQQCLFSTACNMFLGLTSDTEKLELMEPFEKVIRGLVCVPLDLPWTRFHKAKAGRQRIFQILDKHITKWRLLLERGVISPVQDLLSVFLTTNGKYMTDKEIKDNVLGVLLAGHEPTASSLAMTMRCLAENPTCYNELKRVHREIASSKRPGEPLHWDDLKKMKYSWRVIQESMRMRPTAAAIIRRALVDFEMEGFTIPKGWQLFTTVYSTHMNEEYFPNPNVFDPSRFEGTGPVPYTYFPFGGGPRICLGIEQTKMQVLVFLHHMVTRFDWILVEPDEPIQLIPMASPAHNFPLKLVPNTIEK